MTQFQIDCLSKLRHLYEKLGVTPEEEAFEEHSDFKKDGDEEYFRHRFSLGERKFEVFVYVDEAGYDVNGKWFVFETQDYKTAVELIEDALKNLEKIALGQRYDARPVRQLWKLWQLWKR